MSKKKLKKQFRSFELSTPEGAEYVVEGYAAVFNQIVPLFEKDGVIYYEVILPGAFDGADMSNVIMYYSHRGKPVAVTSNDTLRLSVDEHGLRFWAYLGGTEEGRNLWEEIKGGYITKMSFCFDMAEECDFFDGEFTRRVTKITDVYDVSATEQPAYPGTEVHARSADDSVKNKIREKLKNKNINTKRSSEKMTLAQIIARLAEIASRRTAIEAMLDAENPTFTDIDGNPVTEEDILAELDALDEEEEQLEADKAALEADDSGADDEGANKRNILTRRGVQRNVIGKGGVQQRASSSFVRNGRTAIKGEQLRSVLVSSGAIATPTGVKDIRDPFNSVSSIVDQVTVEDCTGLGSLKIPFVKAWQEADGKTEGQAAKESDTDFGTADIKSFDVAVTTYLAREYSKKTPIQYENKVKEGAGFALKKKVASLIVHGSTDGTVKGVYNAKDSEGNNMCKEIEITEIASNTLREIVFSYGGDENLLASCRLYLNKKDLAAFGDVKDLDDRKVYEITPDADNPNTGIIKDGGLSVKYTICSATNVLSAAETEAGTNTMFYGDPKAYTLGLFGDYEIRTDESAKAPERLITILGDATVGGNVTMAQGFTVVKKKA